MGELLCHLIGDYCLQTHGMALNKTKSSLWALTHAIAYTLPFLVLTRNPVALAIIFGTHFVIDRFAIGRMWPKFWGVGTEGWLWKTIGGDSYVAPEPPPPFLAVWLAIIVDNTLHLLINHLALMI